jgi:hypothetical protein
MIATYRYDKSPALLSAGLLSLPKIIRRRQIPRFSILIKTCPDVPIHELPRIPTSHEISQSSGKSFHVRNVGTATINDALAPEPAIGIQQINFSSE